MMPFSALLISVFARQTGALSRSLRFAQYEKPMRRWLREGFRRRQPAPA